MIIRQQPIQQRVHMPATPWEPKPSDRKETKTPRVREPKQPKNHRIQIDRNR